MLQIPLLFCRHSSVRNIHKLPPLGGGLCYSDFNMFFKQSINFLRILKGLLYPQASESTKILTLGAKIICVYPMSSMQFTDTFTEC